MGRPNVTRMSQSRLATNSGWGSYTIASDPAFQYAPYSPNWPRVNEISAWPHSAVVIPLRHIGTRWADVVEEEEFVAGSMSAAVPPHPAVVSANPRANKIPEKYVLFFI